MTDQMRAALGQSRSRPSRPWALSPAAVAGSLLVGLGLSVEAVFASGRYTDFESVAPSAFSFGREIWSPIHGIYFLWIVIFAFAGLRLVEQIASGAVRTRTIGLVFSGAGLVGLLCVIRGVQDAVLGLAPYVASACSGYLIRGMTATPNFRKRVGRFLNLINTVTCLRIAICLTTSSSARFVPFYDGVAIAVSGACLISAFLVHKPFGTYYFWCASVAFLGSALIGSRRATIVAIVLSSVLLFSVLRVSNSRRGIGVLVLGMISVAFVVSDAGSTFASGARAIFADGSDGGDYSSAEHLSDVDRGFDLCVQSGLFYGIGPTAPQPFGLAATEAQRLYIHSEWWNSCVGSGQMQALAIGLAAFLLMATGLRRILRLGKLATWFDVLPVVVVGALPFVFTWFPYFSTTQRWPILIGAALGLMGSRFSESESGAVSSARSSRKIEIRQSPLQIL